MFNRVSESGHSCLFPVLWDDVMCVFITEGVVTVMFSLRSLSRLHVFPSVPNLL